MERRTQVHKDMKARKVSEEREKIIHEQQTDKQSEEDKLTAEDAEAVKKLQKHCKAAGVCRPTKPPQGALKSELEAHVKQKATFQKNKERREGHMKDA